MLQAIRPCSGALQLLVSVPLAVEAAAPPGRAPGPQPVERTVNMAVTPASARIANRMLLVCMLPPARHSASPRRTVLALPSSGKGAARQHQRLSGPAGEGAGEA